MRWADFATSTNHKQRLMEMSRKQLLALLRDALMARVRKKISEDHIENWMRRIAERRQDPYSAVQAILAKIGL